MGKGKPRAVEKGVLGQNSKSLGSGCLNIPSGPVFYPTEEEFEDPLEYIYKIRPEAEPYGICKIVPPKSWSPPFALDLSSFSFPTKTQAIHQLQVRPPSWDSETFELEYNRFLEGHCGRKLTKRVVFEGDDLDLCKLFNAVKRYGGHDYVAKEKKWGEVFKFLLPKNKISECSKHVLSQLYREHLYDYEEACSKLSDGSISGSKRSSHENKGIGPAPEFQGSKRRRKNHEEKSVKLRKVKKKEEHGQLCEQCKSGLHGEVMLLCDRCDKGWHIYCLSPPLKRVPLGNWYCFECLNSDKDSFGFVPGKQYSLETFKRAADRARKKWFGSVSATRAQIEKKFWEIVEGSWGEVEVMYGSDLDTSIYGSGFPRVVDKQLETVESELWDKYCASPWNLNNLPKLKGSMLRAVQHGIEGVMVPWLYIGMMFSSFCWHFEDHCFYSMNYMHWGEPKCWYSVPGSEAVAFEKVMKDSLPDLFDVQPDLLFQLVTMLNPSILQEKGVPVYTLLQEPGNIVITFPRSYHGGFNFGLNCAEAVNFAPADWLPHGGFGAQLYQLYRKASVLSHEELLCVVAKNGCDSKVSHYLKKEMDRIYGKEKIWRERLWSSGIVKSSMLSQRKHPEYVGTEEDPVCIICQQHLYLSAVTCRCRSSAFVCLEHWEHLCECKTIKRRLLYRHTLADLSDLVSLTDVNNSEEIAKHQGSLRKHSSSDDSSALTKKVKGAVVSYVDLAEEWVTKSSELFNNPFSSSSYAKALREAEQFIWAGSEMDHVRQLAQKLTGARNWAEGINDSLSRIERWSCGDRINTDKVDARFVENLLKEIPTLCNEPGYTKLKDYVVTARELFHEIDRALSTSCNIDNLENLHSKASDLAVSSATCEKLTLKLSSAKVLVNGVSKCISEKRAGALDLATLRELKSEALQLQVEIPDTEMLWSLLRQAELCQERCQELLKPPIELMNVEVLLADMNGFIVNIHELELLRQYHAEALSWTCHLNNVRQNIHEREDYENIVTELKKLLEDGMMLHIPVNELPLVEVELKKACCLEKASKASKSKESLEFLQQIMQEAVRLQLDDEKLFVHIAGILKSAIQWEQRAKELFERKAKLSDFEDAIRASEDIFLILPSLADVQHSVVEAKSWLKSSLPYLACGNRGKSPCPLLKVEELEDLLSKFDLLKVHMEEKEELVKVHKNCEEWHCRACALLQNATNVMNFDILGARVTDGFALKVDDLLAKMMSAIHDGASLGFDLNGLIHLREAHSSLKWCMDAICLCSMSTVEKVQDLLKTAEELPRTRACSALCSSLTDGMQLLQKAYDVLPTPCHNNRCKLSDAEDILKEVQANKLSFPQMVDQLQNATSKHKSWQEEVNTFFHQEFEERTWSQFLQLKELGNSCAFNCSEMKNICSTFEKNDLWKRRCAINMRLSVDDTESLLCFLVKIEKSLDTSLNIIDESKGRKACEDFVFDDVDSQEPLWLATCNECYHLKCLELPHLSEQTTSACENCQFKNGGLALLEGGKLKRCQRPELRIFIDLLAESQDLGVRADEIDVLRQIVKKGIRWKSSLAEMLENSSSSVEKYLSLTARQLAIASKAADVAGMYDQQIFRDLDLTLAKHAWRVEVNKLLENSPRPLLQQIQHLVKEGLALGIQPGDHYWQKLTKLRDIGLQWAANAEKVATDGGALSLEAVFQLISEGKQLPVHCEEELEFLKARSMLYCICRKPNDQRPMIACDICDEWYHFDCLKLVVAPKTFICGACKPQTEETHLKSQLGGKVVSHRLYVDASKEDPHTPSPSHKRRRKKKKKSTKLSITHKKASGTCERNGLGRTSGIEFLFWQNRKPFRRAAKKRAKVDNLSPFCHSERMGT
ncbi:unnamed protein product [Rhodiola kirilowii]